MTKLLSLLLIFSGYRVLAQPSVPKIILKGVVIDSVQKMPVSFATVSLLDAKTGRGLRSLLTKADGSFELTVPANQEYRLTITYIDYLPRTINLALTDTKRPFLDLGQIAMTLSSGRLQEISVIANKRVLKQDIDRISYDVQADPENKSNDALEMLRKLPMITVDGNDNIQLKGSNSYQIFIDGKPSALMTNDPADVLKAMPAATIQRIEVITIPPAKYDAEGLTGIINIITLKKKEFGFNGSVFGRYNNIFGERGSISVSVKKGKFSLNTFFGLGRQPLVTTNAGTQLNNFSPATILSQRGQNASGGNFNNGHTEASYEPDSLHLLTASLDFNDRRFTQNTFRNSLFFDPPDSLTQSYQLNNLGDHSIHALDLGVNYQLGFRQDRNESLILSYQYASTANGQNNAVASEGLLNYAGSAYRQQNSTSETDQSFQLDFAKPLQNLIIETGAKALFGVNSSNFGDENEDPATGQYLTDTLLTNRFHYHQNIYSIYNTCQLKLEDWTLKGGLRVENTDIRGDYATNDPPLDQHYTNLIPTLSLQRSYGNNCDFTLGFTERIERPILNQLNPFVDRSNPEFIVTGNPGLHPVLNHILELGFSKFAKLSLNSSLNYAFSDNTIQNVTSLINDTVSSTTYLNVGKNQSAGINLSAGYPVTNKWNVNLNAQISHLWITGDYKLQYYRNDGNQGNISAFIRYSVDRDLNMTANFGYFSGNVYLQGKSSDYIYTSLNIIKDFLHKKATFSFTFYDPFHRYNNSTSFTETPDFKQTSFMQYYGRGLRLALNYKFGRLAGNGKTNRAGIKNEEPPGAGNSEN